MRIIYLILVFLMFSFPLVSQDLLNSGSKRGAGLLSGHLQENTQFNLQFGTGFTSMSPGSSMFGSYISPLLQYDISPDFTFIAGGNFFFNQYNKLPQSLVYKSSGVSVHQLTEHSLFAAGKYMITPDIFMTGTIYREQGPIPFSIINPGVYGYSSQGMSMGMGYRISDNFHFGAEVGVNRTNNPYHFYSPFSGPFGRHGRAGHRIFPF